MVFVPGPLGQIILGFDNPCTIEEMTGRFE